MRMMGDFSRPLLHYLTFHFDSVGYNNASSILKCRNGWEQYIGEILEKKEFYQNQK